MAVHPLVVRQIDAARRTGATFDTVVEHLREQGLPDAQQVVLEYAGQVLPDGRTRAQVNPGDPAERGVR